MYFTYYTYICMYVVCASLEVTKEQSTTKAKSYKHLCYAMPIWITA